MIIRKDFKCGEAETLSRAGKSGNDSLFLRKVSLCKTTLGEGKK